ncbi:hypothetical protein TNCV_286131 [Trichonephila clavipes]|nr:hypothetical protein TNCV_286131 [Trichonephila clavipes]
MFVVGHMWPESGEFGAPRLEDSLNGEPLSGLKLPNLNWRWPDGYKWPEIGLPVTESIPNEDGNAGRHRTHIADGFLEGVNICLMDSPSRSSELNPIECVWKIPGKVIPQRNSSPRIPLEFKVALLEENTLLPQTFIDTLVNTSHLQREEDNKVLVHLWYGCRLSSRLALTDKFPGCSRVKLSPTVDLNRQHSRMVVIAYWKHRQMCSIGERSGDLVLQGSVGQSREQFIATCAEFGWYYRVEKKFLGDVKRISNITGRRRSSTYRCAISLP